MILASKGLGHYLHTHYGDRTFHGLYRWNAFDTAILIPYFVVHGDSGVLRNPSLPVGVALLPQQEEEGVVDQPGGHYAPGELPFVTVQLPIFNEQFVIDRLIDAVCRIEYPRDRFESTARRLHRRDGAGGRRDRRALRARTAGLAPQPIVHLHRTNRHGYKAGALDEGLKVARGELVAIFDADFVPSPDWLMKVVDHFAEPGIGMVQTRWTHLNRNYSFMTQVEAILLDGHFVLEHGGRSRSGVFFNFNGTAGVWRRVAISDGGGWQHDTLTEDTDLSYRVQMAGWKFKYLQDVECPASLPIEMTAFKTQQARWAKGLIQTGKEDPARVLKSDVHLRPRSRRGVT